MQTIAINEQKVFNQWSGIITENYGVDAKDTQKLMWMSIYAHNHQMYENAHNYVHLNPNMNVNGRGPVQYPEDTQYGSGDNFNSLLPLAMQVAAQTIAFDLVTVVPMQGPTGVLQYLDYIYTGGRIADFKNNLGEMNPNMLKPTENALMIKLACYSEDENGNKFYPEFELNRQYYVGANNEYRLTFAGRSRVDGKPMFRVEAKPLVEFQTIEWGPRQGGSYAQTPLYEILATELDGSAKAVTFTSYGVDDSEGTSDDQVLEIMVANAPEYVKAFEDHIAAFSGKGFQEDDMISTRPYELEHGEATPANLMEMKTYTLAVKAKTVKVAATCTREQVQDMKQWGIDVMNNLKTALTNELTQTINKDILHSIFELGAEHAEQLELVEGISCSAYFYNGTIKDPRFKNGQGALWLGQNRSDEQVLANIPGHQTHMVWSKKFQRVNVATGAETQGTLQRRIYSKVLFAQNIIANRGRRGPATYAVTSVTMASALQDCAGFNAYPMTNNINQKAGGLYPVGNLAGLTIYVDQNMAIGDNRIAIGRKANQNEPGLFFMPYLMADAVEIIAEGTMSNKVQMMSRYALVPAGMHPQLYYMVLAIGCDEGVEII